MVRPSLHEVLKKHKQRKKEKSSSKRARSSRPRKRARRHAAAKPAPPISKAREYGSRQVAHILLKPSDARVLFLDLPKTHKFWLSSGKEINNLTELYRELVDMEKDVFQHHVTQHKNDFAKWVHDVLADTVLARRLSAARTKLEHTEIVKDRIDELKYHGRRIPKPYSVLDPDYSFIKTDRPRLRRPPSSQELSIERSFRIRPTPLVPDTSFIESHHGPGGDEASKINRIMRSQEAVVSTMQKDVQSKVMLESELRSLAGRFEELSGHISRIEEDLGSMKSGVDNSKEHEKSRGSEQLEQLGKTIRDLRDRERDIMAEMEKVNKAEDRMMNKSNELVGKEKDLSEKESLVLKKEEKYNSLMSKYNELLQKLDRKLETDEQKISSLIGASEHDMHIHTNKGTHHASPVTDMLKMTKAGKDENESISEIDSLIAGIKGSIKKKKYAQARKEIEHAKSVLENSDVSKDYKKSAYYELFELGTDIDLQTK